MVKIRSAEWLVLAAIVASAAAVQVHERLAEPKVQRHAGFAERSACGATRAGVLAARCDTAQGLPGAKDIELPRATSRDSTGRHARPQALWV